jgi:hypothetical protein
MATFDRYYLRELRKAPWALLFAEHGVNTLPRGSESIQQS